MNNFKAEFVTATEEEWICFIREERKNLQFWENKQAYKSKGLSQDLLRAVLSIIVAMPMKADIKHEWHIMETKISKMQKLWEINPPLRCSW